jgi:hypothetical protein
MAGAILAIPITAVLRIIVQSIDHPYAHIVIAVMEGRLSAAAGEIGTALDVTSVGGGGVGGGSGSVGNALESSVYYAGGAGGGTILSSDGGDGLEPGASGASGVGRDHAPSSGFSDGDDVLGGLETPGSASVVHASGGGGGGGTTGAPSDVLTQRTLSRTGGGTGGAGGTGLGHVFAKRLRDSQVGGAGGGAATPPSELELSAAAIHSSISGGGGGGGGLDGGHLSERDFRAAALGADELAPLTGGKGGPVV